MKIAVGGTFQPLHSGHKLLIRKAYELGKDVDIGLTSDRMAGRSRIRPVQSYTEREIELRKWIKDEFGLEPNIMEINDPYGPAVEKDYDYIVVSPETYANAVKINEIRKGKGMKPIEIVRVDYVLAEDGEPISATRIVSGEIDRYGNLLRRR